MICYVGAHLAAVVFVEGVRVKPIELDPKVSVLMAVGGSGVQE